MNNANFDKAERKQIAGDIALKSVIYLFLGFWAIAVLFPFYWMVLTSVKDYGAYNSEITPKLFTLSPTLSNYVQAFTEVPLGRYFLNTAIFTVLTTALMLVIIIPAAFAFARLNFREKTLCSRCSSR